MATNSKTADKPIDNAAISFDINETHTDNWLTLAEHVQAKVLKRSSDISYLHTKAGFLIAAAVIILQVISTLPKFTDSLAVFASISAMVLAIASIALSITSMIASNSASPLNIDDMILQMNKGKMRREIFAKWLVDCYSLANKEFNKVYSKKYYQQLAAASMLVIAILITAILKGIQLYA